MKRSREIAKFASTNYLDLSELNRFSSAEFVVELLNKVNISDFDFFGEFLRLEELLVLFLRVSFLLLLGTPLKTLLETLLVPLIEPSTETLSGSLSAKAGTFDTLLIAGRLSVSQPLLVLLNFEFAF